MNIDTGRLHSALTDRRKLIDLLAMAGLLLLCINPAWTQGSDNKNLLLAAAMCLSPLALLIRATRIWIPKIDIPAAGVILFSVMSPLLFHPETIRWITILFTCACCIYFMILARLISASSISAGGYMKLIKWIIYAYTAVLIIQQVCTLCGWPVLLKSDIPYRNPFKLNSLSAEPSHTSFILGMLAYFYMTAARESKICRNIGEAFFKALPMWICFLWTLFTTDNASAFFAAPLCLLPWLTRRSWAPIVGISTTVMIILFITTPLVDNRNFMRAQRVLFATLKMNAEKVDSADISAAARISPTIRGAKAVATPSIATVTGHGVDADLQEMPPVKGNMRPRGSAGAFKMWYNYGFPAAVSLWALILTATITRRRKLSWLTAFIAFAVSAEFNMQLLWLVLAFAFTYKVRIARDNGLSATSNFPKTR